MALQVHRATVRVSWTLNLSGERPVRWKKWEPSQKGWWEKKKSEWGGRSTDHSYCSQPCNIRVTGRLP